MGKNDDVIRLKKDISNNKLQKLYVFYGEETFLIDQYVKRISDMIPDMGLPEMNSVSIDGTTATLEEIRDALDSFPVMTDKKLIVIKESGAFAPSEKGVDKKSFYTDAISKLQEDTVLVFRESKVDKRSSVYKAASKAGTVVEFRPLSYSDLTSFCLREIRNGGKKITRECIEYLLSVCDNTLLDLKNEISKLVSTDDEEITKSLIDKMVSKSMETKIFDLSDFLMEKNSQKAIKLVSDLKLTKEYPLAIMYLLYGTFDKMLKTKLMQENHEPREAIIKSLGIPPFIADKYFKGAKGFTTKRLSEFLRCVPLYELRFKSGEFDEWRALEMLIFDTLNAES